MCKNRRDYLIEFNELKIKTILAATRSEKAERVKEAYCLHQRSSYHCFALHYGIHLRDLFRLSNPSTEGLVGKTIELKKVRSKKKSAFVCIIGRLHTSLFRNR